MEKVISDFDDQKFPNLQLTFTVQKRAPFDSSFLALLFRCSEYFDSNDVTSADSGQTFPKTEIGQTLSTIHKVGTQSRTYTSNESLGCSMSFQDNPRMPRIRMENTDQSDHGKKRLA
jgi:hypothetical protein